MFIKTAKNCACVFAITIALCVEKEFNHDYMLSEARRDSSTSLKIENSLSKLSKNNLSINCSNEG